MSRSTRLLTATYILSYVAANQPEVVTTDRIAEKVDEHPSRVRQLVAALVKRGLLAASRGAAGGVSLGRPAVEISLRDIQEAVQDSSLLALHLFEPKSEWAGKSRVHLVFENLQSELQRRIEDYLDEHTLDQTYTPIVVPFAPGGSTDILAGVLGAYLGAELGAPVLIEHLSDSWHGGGGGGLVRPHMSQARLGATTLSIMTSSGVLSAALADPAIDPATAFIPVTLLAESEMFLAVRARSKWKTVKQLATSARSGSRRLKFASVGRGSLSHLAGELFRKAAGADLDHIAFEGARPAVEALIAGAVDLYFGTPPTFLPYVRSGVIRVLATTARREDEASAGLPRMVDYYPGFEIEGWHGVFASPGTKETQVKRLHKRISEVMAMAAVRRQLARQGFRLATSTPKQLAKRIASEVEQWQELITRSGIEVHLGEDGM